MSSGNALSSRPVHVMTKPIGPLCNIGCEYCFYLEKESLFDRREKFRMSDGVLERYVKDYIDTQPPGAEVTFAWQGGEPTLMGVDFFRRAVALQKQYGGGRRIANAFQTNGTRLDDEWCHFFKEESFLVGVSIDGPKRLHDTYRVDKKGAGTWDQVMAGIRLLKKHGVEFNTLTCVHQANVDHPLEVYRFLRKIGSGYIQFIPIVERKADDEAVGLGLELHHPPAPGDGFVDDGEPVTRWSVRPRRFGKFLCSVFDEWVKRDVGKVYVQLFDVSLGTWLGMGSSLCVHAETCGTALALEHNGDLYSCDHYVYPKYKLGNVLNATIREMVDSPEQVAFGQAKKDKLTPYCRECEYLFACGGDCPKHRFATAPGGEPGLSYLCPTYKMFFAHVDPAMRRMAGLYRSGHPPAEIMKG